MDYKPIKNAMSYLADVYYGIKDITQKIGNSLTPSGLELALEGVPNSLIDKKPIETSDIPQGYLFFAGYTVTGYRPNGRAVVVTRSDGEQITIERPRNGTFAEGAVKRALADKGISANNKLIGKIAKLLREKH